ncbi:hypothetical protein CR513_01444, partial [Mucuna pruriens]
MSLPGHIEIFRAWIVESWFDVALKIKEGVERQWNAGFLAVANYLQWVANIVPITKKDEKVQICVDYRDLNCASPKGNFLLPHIDVLVDNIAQHAFFSFMDNFSGYNQILMSLEDREKMTFITLWETFFYKVMPFGLKNAGATYQRAMMALFHDMMHKQIKRHRSRPRQSKSHQRNADPENRIGDPRFPRTGKLYSSLHLSANNHMQSDIQAFLEKPKLEWDSACQQAFGRIKQYLENPLVLVPTVLGKPLILYLTVLEESLGCVLGQQDATGRKEKAIYYLSKKFTDCEKRYPTLERTCCALVWAAKRLRQYMLSHTTWLVAKTDPIKYIFEKLALTGQIARWQMALSEYDIVYVNQKAIKGSVLVEHLAYHLLAESQPLFHEFPDKHIMAATSTKPQLEELIMWFDGASNLLGNGIGVALASPKDQCFPFSAKLGFDCTNNMAEYEACTMRLMMGLDSVIPSSTTIAMDDGDDPPLLARTLRIKSTRVRWCSNRSPLEWTQLTDLTELQVESLFYPCCDLHCKLLQVLMWRLSWCRGGSVLLTWSATWTKLPACAIGCMGRVFSLAERLSAWASSGGLSLAGPAMKG